MRKLITIIIFLIFVSLILIIQSASVENFSNKTVVDFRRKHCFVNGPAVLEVADSPVIMTPTTEAAQCCYRTQTVCNVRDTAPTSEGNLTARLG